MHDVNRPMAVSSIQSGTSVDDLGEAVLAGLARPIGNRQAWRAFPTFFWGILTFGFAPLLMWQKRFKQFATLEQQQLLHLAKWVGLHGAEHEADEMRHEAQQIDLASIFSWLSFMCLCGVAWTIYRWFALTGRPISWQTLFNFTTRFSHNRVISAHFPFLVWQVGIAIGYALQWLRIQHHASRVERFMTNFNQVLVRRGLPVVKTIKGPWMPTMGWWIGGAICLYLWSFWGIVMMFAGAAQRRVIRVCSTQNRQQMAWRLRSLMLAESPNANVPIPIYLQKRCMNPACKATLPPSAQFCPRCGQGLARAAG
jgi:hypothetical protein